MQIWLFDIDGTLVDTGGAGKRAMAKVLSSEFGVGGSIDGIDFAGRTDRRITRDLFSALSVEESAETIEQFHASYLRELPNSLRHNAGRVLPGVKQWLSRIRSQRSAYLGLLTGNLEKAARQKLEHFELWDYFHFGGYGDHHSDRADVAAAAVAAAERHLKRSTVAVEIWVVGDTPRDVQCARSIGAKALAVATGSYSAEELSGSEPDLLLRDLTDSSSLSRLLIDL